MRSHGQSKLFSPRILLATVVLSISLSGTDAKAEAPQWPKIEGLQFNSRLAITVENPTDFANDAAVVHLSLSDLAKRLPDAKPGQIAVIDPSLPKPRRDAADEFFIPFQTTENELTFSLPLNAREKRQLLLYTTPVAGAPFPGFPAGTHFDSRKAYRSFENKYAAFRIETGPGANTTGMTIDCFGKTAAGKGLRLTEMYQKGHDAYHNLDYWGVDILKVGNGPGLGGLYLYAAEAVGRPTYQTISTECLYSGPVETAIRFSGPITVAGKRYTVSRVLTLVADDRSIRDTVTVEGDDLAKVQIGIGVRDLPNCKWNEDPARGIGFQTGDANQPHYKAVGLGCLFSPDEYVRTIDLPDKKDPGHVYVLKGKMEDGKLVSRHRLASIWDMDGQLPKPVETAAELTAPFAAFFDQWSADRDAPIKVTLGERAETAASVP